MRNMKSAILFSVVIMSLSGCKTAPTTKESRDVLNAETIEAISVFNTKDPGIQHFFDTAYGYAVFPRIYKGGFWVGGAYGRGQVYRQKELIGYSSMTQASLGFSFGGEYFREVIFFDSKPEFDNFVSGQYALSGQVTGVAISAGVAAKATYQNGVLVFMTSQKGLMVDVSVAGQKFEFVPLSIAQQQ
jgi:lipid-binding SYLF domain-containing protein